jgi:hypothetical protein
MIPYLNLNSTNLLMITDHERNQFYDAILKETVPGKTCIEVGFGSGILSFLALKYAPKHIIAYESDPDAYAFGSRLIKKFGLTDKITLINDIYAPSDMDIGADLIYHEILGPNLWDESVYDILQSNIPMVPSEYRCDFYICEISRTEFDILTSDYYKQNQRFQTWYNTIKGSDWPSPPQLSEFDTLPLSVKNECIDVYHFDKTNIIKSNLANVFDPGVTFNVNYIEEMQNMLNDYHASIKSSPIHKITAELNNSEGQRYIDGGYKFMSLVINQNNKTVSTITDSGETIRDFNPIEKFIDLTIDKSLLVDKLVVIQPIYSLAHHNTRIYLHKTNCWGPSSKSIIIDHAKTNITARQHFFNIDNCAQICYYVE